MFIDKNITASIVIYNENFKVLEKAMNSFLGSPLSKKLYIIDNSPSNVFKNKIQNDSVEYIYSDKNISNQYFNTEEMPYTDQQAIEDAKIINKAVRGFGTDEETVYQVLWGKTEKEIGLIKKWYKHYYNETLEAAIKRDFTRLQHLY